MTNIKAPLTNGLSRLAESTGVETVQSLSAPVDDKYATDYGHNREKMEHRVFTEHLQMVPGLEDRQSR